MKMAGQSSEEDTIRACEAYCEKHEVQRLLKECIVQLCMQRPNNPVAFLRDYFAKLDKVRSPRCHHHNDDNENNNNNNTIRISLKFRSINTKVIYLDRKHENTTSVILPNS